MTVRHSQPAAAGQVYIDVRGFRKQGRRCRLAIGIAHQPQRDSRVIEHEQGLIDT